jgi:hypothetical protein
MAAIKKSPKKKRASRGPATKFSTAELTEIAKVSAADIAKAKAFWRRSVPEKYRSLLDAKAT